MELKTWFKPFEKLKGNSRLMLIGFWLLIVFAWWFIGTSGEKSLLPAPQKVLEGMKSLYNEGLVVHIMSSLGLCLQATLISIGVSLVIAYLSPVPFIKPVANFLSQLRYLPLTGITCYLAMIVTDARAMQVWVLVVFMSLYFITSLLGVIRDIPQEEIDHARSLGCSRWEVLWEVVVKGRLDYVIEVLRQNLAITWMMLVTVESILVAAGGLGVLIKNSDRFMNHGRILALQIVILLVGLGIDLFLNYLRKLLFRYSKI
ncbi:MAG: ABC transporter permease subunit [Saprospiraceae bacterium]|nr:ABC transporter permease subunit [Saprospiraceae bacterium]